MWGNLWSSPKGLASRQSWVEIEEYGISKLEWLQKFLALPNGIPSKDTIRRLFAQGVRSHWSIENQLHWCLDVAFNEDDSRIRSGYAPENMALIRHIALNLLGRETSVKAGKKAKRKKAGWDNAYLTKVLAS